MSLFDKIFKKKPGFAVQVKTFESPRYLAGMQTTTSKKTFKKEISIFQSVFNEKRQRLVERTAPRGTVIINGIVDADGRFSYFIGDMVDIPEQDPCFKIVTLEPGQYAHITIDFKVPNDLALSVAKAKNYFFNTWLPESGYTIKGDVESMELYDRRSSIKLPSIDLIFPLIEKN